MLRVAGGVSLPVGGGSYWRVLPGAVVESALKRSETHAALYFHPYEFDPEQLRVGLLERPVGQAAGPRGVPLGEGEPRPEPAARVPAAGRAGVPAGELRAGDRYREEPIWRTYASTFREGELV